MFQSPILQNSTAPMFQCSIPHTYSPMFESSLHHNSTVPCSKVLVFTILKQYSVFIGPRYFHSSKAPCSKVINSTVLYNPMFSGFLALQLESAIMLLFLLRNIIPHGPLVLWHTQRVNIKLHSQAWEQSGASSLWVLYTVCKHDHKAGRY